MAFLTGWGYRKAVTISRASGAVTNYQMKILVGESSGATGEDVDCGGLCKTDFSDLRFTKADGTTLLDYWIESVSGTTPNQLATVWVEFDSIGTGATTFYMYYGNAGASAASNGDNTFDFFEDWSAAFAKWTGNTANYQISGGYLQRKSYDTWIPKTLKSTTTFNPNDYALRWRARESPTTDGLFPVGFYYSDTRFGGLALNTFNGAGDRAYDWTVIADGGTGTSGGDGTLAVNTWYVLDVFKPTTTSYRAALNGGVLGTSNVTNATNPHYVGISTYENTASWLADMDWILVRKFNAVEPAWGTWGSQETPPSGGGGPHFFIYLLSGGGR
jgi:hypothetical protein